MLDREACVSGALEAGKAVGGADVWQVVMTMASGVR